MRSAQTSIIPQFIEVMEAMGLESAFTVTKDEIVNNSTGVAILFRGIKTSSGIQTANLKSLTGITDWILDEAEELVDEKTFTKINYSVRVKGLKNHVIMVMNPTAKTHWIYERFFESGPQPNTNYIHTTYLDNIDNLNEDIISDYENLKERNLKEYEHVILGGWLDKVDGVIYPDYEIGSFNNDLPFIYGMDFGVNDPDALVKVAIDKKSKIIYAKECIYKNNLSTDKLLELVKHETGKKLIVADSSGKRTILDFRRAGVNIKKCKKGPNSIVSGIKLIKGYKLIIEGANLVKELNMYKWHDVRSETPVDDYNHILDALRYAVTELLRPSTGVRI